MFIKALMVDFSQVKNDKEDIFIKLEELISEFLPELEYDFLEDSIILYRNNYINNDSISFVNYFEEGKILKNFLIENDIANENNYKQFFSLQKRELDIYHSKIEQANEQEWQQERVLLPSELDALIVKVDKNDPKLVDVLNKIKNIKK